MHLPEAAQVLMGRLRQRDEAVLVALGVSHMHAPTRAVDVANFKAQSFTQAQPQAVEREEEHLVAAHARGGDDPPGLLDGDDIGQALDPRWLDQPRRHPGLTQDVLVVELQPIQIELDGTPRVRVRIPAKMTGVSG